LAKITQSPQKKKGRKIKNVDCAGDKTRRVEGWRIEEKKR